jgi:hypothetical protein
LSWLGFVLCEWFTTVQGLAFADNRYRPLELVFGHRMSFPARHGDARAGSMKCVREKARAMMEALGRTPEWKREDASVRPSMHQTGQLAELHSTQTIALLARTAGVWRP